MRTKDSGENSYPLMIFVGVICLLGALYGEYNSFLFKRTALSASGRITSYVPRKNSKGGTTYASVYSYTVGQKTYSLQSSVSTGSIPVVGEEVTILYPPGSPQDGRANTFLEFHFMSLIFSMFGLILSLVGGYFWQKTERRQGEILVLKRRGQVVMAKVIEVVPHEIRGMRVKNWSRVRVVHNDVVYLSDGYRSLPPNMPYEVPVYIDPQNRLHYYVDIFATPNSRAG